MAVGCAESNFDSEAPWRVPAFDAGTDVLSHEELTTIVNHMERFVSIPTEWDPHTSSEIKTDKTGYRRFYAQVEIENRVFVVGHYGKEKSHNLQFIAEVPDKTVLSRLSTDGYVIVDAKFMPALHSHGGCWALKIVYDVRAKNFLTPPTHWSNQPGNALCMETG